jgi:hypothetical protein
MVKKSKDTPKITADIKSDLDFLFKAKKKDIRKERKPIEEKKDEKSAVKKQSEPAAIKIESIRPKPKQSKQSKSDKIFDAVARLDKTAEA